VIVLAVAQDLLAEARSRRWVLAFLAAATLVLVAVALGLRFEVVDGALAATRLFGGDLRSDVRAVDVALRPLFAATSYVVFYGGLVFGIVATADFAPTLLAPGRIEPLLALPLRRWHVLAGTFLGVELLVLAAALYGGAGVSVLLWIKTGVANAGPLAAAAAAAVAFAPVYAAMLATALVARSAALSAGAGLLTLVAGIVAGNRAVIAELFLPGASRSAFVGLTAVLPRLSSLGRIGAAVSRGGPVAAGALLALVAGTVAFALALLALGVDRFDRKDF
jgi:ABC-type transport system involved in multi-copper enzyme maturation permease subunit